MLQFAQPFSRLMELICVQSTVCNPVPPVSAVDEVGCSVQANAREHADLVRRTQARIVVFPELSLTGDELAADPVSREDAELEVIVEACTASEAIALVGRR